MIDITYYGHACFNANINGINLLFDPFISSNHLAKNIDIDAIEADYILISHGHEDHIADLNTIAKNTNAKIISNFEITNWITENFNITNCHPMNHGGSWEFDFGKVKYVNAVHSSVMPDGANGGNPGGFVVKSNQGNFYYAGDTALHMDMKLIPLDTKIDFALLPIGDNFTMGIQDAIHAANFVETKKVVGLHYDTFGFIEIDHNEAINSFKKNNLQLHLLDVGNKINING
jgi:L-ascorbate metabolism protein UlaG (beta-lactamase superfamily)